MTAQNLNRPPSGISTDSKNTGATGREVQPDASHCEGTDAINTGVDSLDEGSIRQDQLGYAGS